MLFCERYDCKYRSKRKSNSYTIGGKPAYKCTAKHTLIVPYADGNSDVYQVMPNGCQCITFRKREEI